LVRAISRPCAACAGIAGPPSSAPHPANDEIARAAIGTADHPRDMGHSLPGEAAQLSASERVAPGAHEVVCVAKPLGQPLHPLLGRVDPIQAGLHQVGTRLWTEQELTEELVLEGAELDASRLIACWTHHCTRFERAQLRPRGGGL